MLFRSRYDKARKQRRDSTAGNIAADSGGSAGEAIDDAAELEKLARMGLLDYERSRKAAGERLGIRRLAMLDSLVKAKRA